MGETAYTWAWIRAETPNCPSSHCVLSCHTLRQKTERLCLRMTLMNVVSFLASVVRVLVLHPGTPWLSRGEAYVLLFGLWAELEFPLEHHFTCHSLLTNCDYSDLGIWQAFSPMKWLSLQCNWQYLLLMIKLCLQEKIRILENVSATIGLTTFLLKDFFFSSPGL